MLRFYVSVRPIRIQTRLYGPKEQFKSGFKGIDIIANQIGCNREIDGRYLYEVIIGSESEYSPEELAEYKAIILEGLQAWSVHEKSLESALELAEKLNNIQYEISGDKIQPVSE